MTSTAVPPRKAFILVVLGLAAVAFGIYSLKANPAEGAPVGATMAMLAGLVLIVRAARNHLPKWAARTTIAVGAVAAAVGSVLTHQAVVSAALFPQPGNVPSVIGAAPSPQYAAGVERARSLVRTALLEQNLPGVSVAAGAGGAIIWEEGFGWRDIATKTPVTPDTRFNIGTAASAVIPYVKQLGLTNSGSESAGEWSPGHVGEPEEDFPGFTIAHDLIFRPLGLSSPLQPLPGDRATFYVPRSDDRDPRKGRGPMFMRDLACCADRMTFYSTPSDLVRVGLATQPGNIDGALAGGMVTSLISRRESGVVVAVSSNIAYANTAAIAEKIALTIEGH